MFDTIQTHSWSNAKSCKWWFRKLNWRGKCWTPNQSAIPDILPTSFHWHKRANSTGVWLRNQVHDWHELPKYKSKHHSLSNSQVLICWTKVSTLSTQIRTTAPWFQRILFSQYYRLGVRQCHQPHVGYQKSWWGRRRVAEPTEKHKWAKQAMSTVNTWLHTSKTHQSVDRILQYDLCMHIFGPICTYIFIYYICIHSNETKYKISKYLLDSSKQGVCSFTR